MTIYSGSRSRSSALKQAKLEEISIVFQFDCCPQENRFRWEIWTTKAEFYGNAARHEHENGNFIGGHDGGDRMIIIYASNRYPNAEPYSIINETIVIDDPSLAFTLTVYDDGNNGLEDRYHYEVYKTTLIRNDNTIVANNNSTMQWQRGDRTTIAEVHGSFQKNDHALTGNATLQASMPIQQSNGQQQLYQPRIKTQQHQQFVLKNNQEESSLILEKQYSQLHQFMVITTVLFIGALFLINVIVGFAMYRMRQRGKAIQALDYPSKERGEEESRAFMDSSGDEEDYDVHPEYEEEQHSLSLLLSHQDEEEEQEEEQRVPSLSLLLSHHKEIQLMLQQHRSNHDDDHQDQIGNGIEIEVNNQLEHDYNYDGKSLDLSSCSEVDEIPCYIDVSNN